MNASVRNYVENHDSRRNFPVLFDKVVNNPKSKKKLSGFIENEIKGLLDEIYD